MRIGVRLVLSYFGIIVLTGIGMFFLTEWIVKDITSRNILTAKDALTTISDENLRFSEHELTQLGERLVRLKSIEVAALLSWELGSRDVSDYELLRKDSTLRRIAIQDIRTSDGIAGHTDVFDTHGVAVWHPNIAVQGKNYRDWKGEFPEMWELVKRSFAEPEVQGYYTFLTRTNTVKRKYMVLTQVHGTPFVAAAVVEIDKFFLPTHYRIKAAQEEALHKAQHSIAQSSESAALRVDLIGLAGSLVVLLMAGGIGLWLARSISIPVMRLRDGVTQVAAGDFAAQVEETGPEEVKQLAQSFNALGRQLTDYVDNLSRASAAKQKMESELSIAAQIQRSLLPAGFSPFPDSDVLDIYAVMQPARHVGGDFYDFFAVDENRLCLAIGDVCGKGIPASLLMAVTKSLLATAAGEGHEPDRALQRVNRQLSVNNESCVFVTLFCAILDPSTGDLVYANAGHDPPVVMREGNRCEFLGPPTGPVLGLFPDAVFPTQRLTLRPGDTLFTFTDGVTEAMDKGGDFFSKERLCSQLGVCREETARGLIQYVLEEVLVFSQGTPQADDITMLAVKLAKPGAPAAAHGSLLL
jgi:serine phosphatase RsbU (regulator of sigma subunit)